jgi:hypothetical protein
MKSRICIRVLLLALSLYFGATVNAQKKSHNRPMVLQEQASFAIGGRVITTAEGYTIHGDHAYVFYQKPVKPRKFPLVFLHGIYQFSKTWETTPDGREGFQNIFLRRSFSTYNFTQPRRGNAGNTAVGDTIRPIADKQIWFNRFRVGIWPNYYEGVQFSKEEETLNQYFRQSTPNTGPFDFGANSDAVRL